MKIFSRVCWLAAAIAISLVCSCRGHHPSTAKARLYLPECLILRADSPPEDLNIKAYEDALDAVALNYRIRVSGRNREVGCFPKPSHPDRPDAHRPFTHACASAERIASG